MAQKQTEAPAALPPRRRGRPSAAQSARITDEILDVAADMFVELDFEGVTMEAVAARLGIPKTTIYKRYSDKADLLRAAIEARMNRWSAISGSTNRLDPDDDMETRLAGHVATLLAWTTKPEVRAMNRLAAKLPEGSGHGIANRHISGYRGMHALLTAVIAERGPGMGIVARDPGDVAEMLMAVIAGTVALRSQAEPITPEEAQPIARGIVDRLIRGAAAW